MSPSRILDSILEIASRNSASSASIAIKSKEILSPSLMIISPSLLFHILIHHGPIVHKDWARGKELSNKRFQNNPSISGQAKPGAVLYTVCSPSQRGQNGPNGDTEGHRSLDPMTISKGIEASLMAGSPGVVITLSDSRPRSPNRQQLLEGTKLEHDV